MDVHGRGGFVCGGVGDEQDFEPVLQDESPVSAVVLLGLDDVIVTAGDRHHNSCLNEKANELIVEFI